MQQNDSRLPIILTKKGEKKKMSKLLNEMYEEVEREQINDKLKEFVDGLSDEEKGRLKKIVNLSEDEPEEEEPEEEEPEEDEPEEEEEQEREVI